MTNLWSITYKDSITDIINCLKAHETKTYHLGIKKVVSISSLTRANKNRDWRIYKDFENALILF